MAKRKKVLVAGALGVVGRAVMERFASATIWKPWRPHGDRRTSRSIPNGFQPTCVIATRRCALSRLGIAIPRIWSTLR